MRYPIEFDGLTALDVGRTVPAISINHDEIGTPHALGGSVLDFLVRHHPRLREVAIDQLLNRHSQLFHYEDGTEARRKLDALLGVAGAVAESVRRASTSDMPPWMVGDALRLELVLGSAHFQLVEQNPRDLTEFTVIEMMRNGYRRLHRLEQPTGAQFFNVFMQTGQPTQIPLDVLYSSVIDGRQPTAAEAIRIMKENPTFWKAELQGLANAFLISTCHDPALITLQNAAIYQKLKQFFSEE